jgi:hypothetical protein
MVVGVVVQIQLAQMVALAAVGVLVVLLLEEMEILHPLRRHKVAMEALV